MAGFPTNIKVRHIAAATAAAALLATGYEGTSYVAYQDPRPGDPIWTICNGHTGPEVKRGETATAEECKQLLNEDMRNAVLSVERCHPDLPLNVLVAFSDAAYNIGPKVACDSTASRYLTEGKYQQACDQLLNWNKSNGKVLPGLTKRRKEERDVCLGSVQLQQE